MTKLEQLHDMADENDINIVNAHFSDTKKATCRHRENRKNIILDKSAIESQSEEKILLAEEIAHYETGGLYMIETTYNTPLARSNRRKYEAIAKQWAIFEILPFDDLCEAVARGNYEIYEIAEYLNLTEDFVVKAIELYKRKGMSIG